MPPARCSLLETIPNNGGGGVLRIPADGAQPIQFDRLSFEPTRHSILAPPLITLGAHSQLGPKARYAQIEGPGAPQERPHIRIRVFYCAATDVGSGHLVRNSRVPGAVGDVYVCKLLKHSSEQPWKFDEIQHYQENDTRGYVKKVVDELLANGVPLLLHDSDGFSMVASNELFYW